eukprot:6172055-Pleurochrysis_carterae.AAC.3
MFCTVPEPRPSLFGAIRACTRSVHTAARSFTPYGDNAMTRKTSKTKGCRCFNEDFHCIRTPSIAAECGPQSLASCIHQRTLAIATDSDTRLFFQLFFCSFPSCAVLPCTCTHSSFLSSTAAASSVPYPEYRLSSLRLEC